MIESAGATRTSEGCVACHATTTFFGWKKSYTYARCPLCGTLQLSPLPQATEIERIYKDSQYSADNQHGQGDADQVRKASAAHYHCVREALQAYAGRGEVLDYGAGWGGLVEVLRAAGFSARGLELSAGMVKECQRRGLPVEGGDLSTRPIAPASLSAVTMCGVFEHLLTPDAFLDQVYAGLKPGGIFLSLQPTAPFARLLASVLRLGRQQAELPQPFYIFDPPWHAALYSVRGMCQLAERHGFRVRAVRPVPQGRFPGFTGVLQGIANPINKVGWALAGTAWPLMVSHLFVFEKAEGAAKR